MPSDNSLGAQVKTLKQIRSEMGITQQDLAERCDISQPHLSWIERSVVMPTKRTAETICDELGVWPADVFEFARDVSMQELTERIKSLPQNRYNLVMRILGVPC